jgi:hypothetical protein
VFARDLLGAEWRRPAQAGYASLAQNARDDATFGTTKTAHKESIGDLQRGRERQRRSCEPARPAATLQPSTPQSWIRISRSAYSRYVGPSA